MSTKIIGELLKVNGRQQFGQIQGRTRRLFFQEILLCSL